MNVSETVKLIVKIKNEYWLDKSIYDPVRMHVNDTFFKESILRVINSFYKVDLNTSREIFGNLQEFLTKNHLILESLFAGIDNTHISDLIATAAKRSGFVSQNIFNFFVIEVPEEQIEQVVKRLVSNPEKDYGIEYTYIRGEIADQDFPEKSDGKVNPVSKLLSITDRFAHIHQLIDGFNPNSGHERKPLPAGEEIRIVDVEQGWDLGNAGISAYSAAQNVIRMLGEGISHTSASKIKHGTNTLNVLLGSDSSSATLNGLCLAGASAMVSSVWFEEAGRKKERREAALAAALNPGVLSYGDVVLLELQIAIAGYSALLPVEIEPAMFELVNTGTAAGYVIIEAAANGGVNLGNVVYPANSNYIVLSDSKSSGAIMVGSLTKGRNQTNWYRDPYTNSGNRVDCYCYGNPLYTAAGTSNGQFNGTSLASAMVAALAVNLQIITKQQQKPLISPGQMKQFLKSSGVPVPDSFAGFLNN